MLQKSPAARRIGYGKCLVGPAQLKKHRNEFLVNRCLVSRIRRAQYTRPIIATNPLYRREGQSAGFSRFLETP